MALNLGLSGQPFAGPDIGGYAGNGPGTPASNDRSTHFARWMGIATLLPFCRAHTEKGNLDKEPWSFGPEAEASCRRAIERRYRLLPYIYTLFREAAETGLPVVRPTFFAEPNNMTLRSEDASFMLGESLMIGCRTTPDAAVPSPLPLQGWTQFRLPGEPVDANLPDLYVKQGAIIPVGPVMQFVDEKNLDPLTLVVSLDKNGEAKGTLYEDAGDGFGYLQGDYRLTTFTAKVANGSISINSTTEGNYPPIARQIEVLALPNNTHVHPSLESSRLP
jgi:alpha-glucosidase